MPRSILFIALIACLMACSKTPSQGELVTINLKNTNQTIHSFGASDAWRCQFVGENWPLEKREQMAEWLFSKELDEAGNPKGIGLSMWRFYLGAGSREQGVASGIKTEWRRGECFLSADGTYDWNKQKGQTWFLEKSMEYGVEYRKAFMISPPVHFTLNGRALSDPKRQTLNLREGMMEPFADYMIEVLDYYNNTLNIPLDYISPINEPQWAWDGSSQEGTPASNEEIYDITKRLSEKLDDKKLDTKVIIAESGMLEFISDADIETKEDDDIYLNRKNQAKFFFDPESEYYIGNMSNVEYALCGHSYFSSWTPENQVNVRKRLAKTIEKVNPEMNFWQSEFCILEKNEEIEGGWKRDLEMPTALYVARLIHNDLVLANACNWQWWTALTQCDFKDGLIYLDSAQHCNVPSLKYNGDFHDSKLMWGFGQYSRFVRPGMQRVGLIYSSACTDVEKCNDMLISAYKGNGKIVLVVINFTDKLKSINLDIQGKPFYKKFEDVKVYETSEKHNLALVGKYSLSELFVSPYSITTFVIE